MEASDGSNPTLSALHQARGAHLETEVPSSPQLHPHGCGTELFSNAAPAFEESKASALTRIWKSLSMGWAWNAQN